MGHESIENPCESVVLMQSICVVILLTSSARKMNRKKMGNEKSRKRINKTVQGMKIYKGSFENYKQKHANNLTHPQKI